MTRSRWAAVLLVLLLGGLAGSPVVAQDVQVPLDRDSTRFVVDAELRRDVGLFPEVSGFQEARLYRSGDAEYVFVVRYEQEGRVLRERRSLSPAEVTDLRARVTKALADTGRRPSRAQEGRYGLVAATTFHGLVEGGLLAGTFDLGASESATLALSGGALGFFAPLLATRNIPVSEAEADMVGYGGLQGYAHAGQVMGVLAGEDLPGQAAAGVVALGGILEGTIGYRVARRNNWSTGHAEMVTVNGAGGNLVGFGIGASLVGETDEPGEGTPRLVAGASLLGSLGGMYLGHRLGQTDRYTEGDARVYALSALQGSYLMGSFLALQDDGSPRAGALLLTGAGVGGAALGHRLIRNRDFTATRGSRWGTAGSGRHGRHRVGDRDDCRTGLWVGRWIRHHLRRAGGGGPSPVRPAFVGGRPQSQRGAGSGPHVGPGGNGAQRRAPRDAHGLVLSERRACGSVPETVGSPDSAS